MNGTGKLIAAFITGILIALIGAVAYVKTHTAAPALEQRTTNQETAATAPAGPAPEEPKALPEAGNVTAAPPPAQTPPHRPVEKKRERRRVEVARNEPPPMPQAQPEPAAPAAPNPYTEATPATAPAPAVAPTPPPPPVPVRREPRSVTLPSGMPIRIRLLQTLSTDQTAEGDTFSGTLDAPIIMDNAIIAEKGSRVLGRVVTSQKAGRVRGVAELAATLTAINTTDGQRVSVQTNSVERDGSKDTKRDAAKVGGGAALGAIIGAIAGGGKGAAIGAGAGGAAGGGDVLLTRGKPAVMGTETLLTFNLAAPVTITEHINQ